MGIYGSYAKKLMEAKQQEAVAENISNEELQNAIFECYSSAIDILSEADQEEIIEEGANVEMTKAWLGSKKEVKEYLKNYKKFLKAKEYKKASSELDKVTKILEKAKKDIKSVDQNAGTAAIGFFADFLVIVLEMFVPLSIEGIGLGVVISGAKGASKAVDAAAMAGGIFDDKEMLKQATKIYGGALATTVGSIWSIIKAVSLIIKEVKTWIKEFKSDGEKLEAKHFNAYRNTLIRYMDSSIKKIDELKRDIPKLEK